jgi:DNA-binding HxlR family transcriptional regulator
MVYNECGQKEVTTLHHDLPNYMDCPAEPILKLISGKWKPQILYLASKGTLRFNSLLRQLPGSSKQSVSAALRELEEAQILVKRIVQEKPLHIEYTLTEKGHSTLLIFRLASSVSKHD